MSTQPEIVHLNLPAAYQYLSLLSAVIGELLGHVEGMSDPERTIYSIQLAAHETCANCIDHAYGGKNGGQIEIKLTLTQQPRQLIVEITDTGIPFDFADVIEPSLEEPREHGYGLFLIRNLMDKVSYDRKQNINHWCLIKVLD